MRLRAGSRRAPLHTAFVPAGAHAGSAPARFASAFTRTAGRPARAVTVAAADPAPSRATCRGPSPPERQETNMPALADIGDGLVPKRETGVAQFLSRHPDCNGDNVVVAILDTGVDPGAPGLRLMPDGTSPKVIDCIDCTGGGDVEMFDATVVEPAAAAGPLGAAPASGDGAAVAGAAPTLTGLSGRSLTLTPEMVASNPTGAYRVGLKAAYALLPKPLVARLKRERRVRFDEAHRVALNAVHRRLDDVRRAADAAAGGEPKAAARLAVEEAEAHEARLIAVAKACEDPGPIYDCVTFHDGRRWRAVVDTSESGDLARCQLMEDYRLACRYATLHDLVNYTTNIWDDGRTLSICVDSGAHGTHVAGMVAAHYPDPGSHMSGSAPGAQIVSLKIGDTRLGAMETHQGLVRALAYLLAHSRAPGSEASAANDGILVDLVNMSFGEPTRNPNHGRFVELATKLVREHNVPFFCSAGNNGPGLTSVSAPGGTTDALIGVGAYVTPDMLTEGYSVLHEDVEESLAEAQAAMSPSSASCGPGASPAAARSAFASSKVSSSSSTSATAAPPSAPATQAEPVVGMPYTWSSRGPAPDGGMGVSVCAPGGAIAAIPQWTLSRKRLMNGTSMASPCACSATAVVLSYLKKHSIPYTSDRLRSAVENSARPLGLSRLVGAGGSTRAAGTAGPEKVKYTEDLVFAGGSGSISVGGACALLESVAAASRSSTAAAAMNGATCVAAAATAAGVRPRDDLEVARPPLEWRYRVSVESVAPLAARKNVASTAGGGVLGGTRGVYLRGRAETRCVQRMSICLDAVRDDEQRLTSSKAALAAMETTVLLEATEGWVTVPKSVLLYGAGRAFPVSVDPTGLRAGQVHYAEVCGFVSTPETLRYRVFRIPVTVVVPEPTLLGSSAVRPVENVEMSPGAVLRRFYEPPICATFGILRVTAAGADAAGAAAAAHGDAPCSAGPGADAASDVTSAASDRPRSSLLSTAVCPATDGPPPAVARPPSLVNAATTTMTTTTTATTATTSTTSSALSSDSRMLDVHIVQVEPRQPTKHTETRQALALISGATKEVLFPVAGGVTVEIAIGHRWSSMGVSSIRAVEVVFCGLKPEPTSLHLPTGAGCFPRLDVTNALPDGVSAGASVGPLNCNPHVISTFHPKATLHSVWRAVPPLFSKISPLGSDRDSLPESTQISQLVLEYKFEVHDHATPVRVTMPGLNGHVYEADLEGGPFVTLHDANKQLLLCSDIYPERRVLQKGTYYARASLRHDRVSLLEKLRELRAVIVYQLSSPISLDCYDTAHGAVLQGDTGSRMKGSRGRDWKGLLEPGEKRSLFFGAPKKSAIPKWAAAGDSLHGDFTIDEPRFADSGDARNTARVPRYALSMPAPVAVAASGKSMIEALAKKGSDGAPSTAADSTEGPEQALEEPSVPSVGDVDDAKWVEDAVKDLRMKALRGFLKDSKLADFDRMSRSVADALSSDTDYLLLKLQRLDANLCSGKGGSMDAKQAAVDDLVGAADNLLARLNAKEIAAHFGVRSVDSEKTDERREFEAKRAMLVAALFRKTRALFSVVSGGADGEQAARPEDDGREKSFNELQRWQKMDGKSFVTEAAIKLGEPGSVACIAAKDLMMLAARRHTLRGCHALALQTLDAYLGSSLADSVASRELADLRLDMLRALNWKHVAMYEEHGILLRFPRGLEPM